MHTVSSFAFGLAVGGLASVTVVREAIPLREHVWAIGLSLAMGVPIFFLLFLWYKSLLKSIRTVLGEKGGTVISSILTFQVVTTAMLFLLIVSIFYAAIA